MPYIPCSLQHDNNPFIHDAIERQMMEVKGVGRRRIQLLDDLRNRRGYWALEEEAEERIDENNSLSIEHMYFP